VTASLRILDDWMVKGMLTGIVTTQAAFAKAITCDKFLKKLHTPVIASLDELAPVLSHYVERASAARTQSESSRGTDTVVVPSRSKL
jgi:hypothetical protein